MQIFLEQVLGQKDDWFKMREIRARKQFDIFFSNKWNKWWISSNLIDQNDRKKSITYEKPVKFLKIDGKIQKRLENWDIKNR